MTLLRSESDPGSLETSRSGQPETARVVNVHQAKTHLSRLIDSHALLWWWFDPDRLSATVQTVLANPATTVLVSAAIGLAHGLRAGAYTQPHPDRSLQDEQL